MLIKTPKASVICESQVTDESVYNQRRDIIKSMGFVGASALLSSTPARAGFFGSDDAEAFKTEKLSFSASPKKASTKLTPEEKIISHNNFYEFGTGKSDPVENAQQFKVNPWRLSIEGLAETPFTLEYDDLFKQFPSRRTDIPFTLRRGMVNGRALDWFFTCLFNKKSQTLELSKIRRI